MLIFDGKETGLEICTNKSQYIVMYEDQDGGRSGNIKTENSSFGIV